MEDHYKVDLNVGNNNYKIFDIKQAAKDAEFDLQQLPFTLRILFENIVRLEPSIEKFKIFKNWIEEKTTTIVESVDLNTRNSEINFMPSRVLMQDFTGVPALVDLAAMRDAIQKLGGDPLKINPRIPVDLVIDHSVQVDYSGTPDSFLKNVSKEHERNNERYEFLKWAQKAFDNFRVVPPDTGICHQINLEYLASVICTKKEHDEIIAYPDTVIGTDSHTTMVNGLAVLGWGVGGIEAESAMLGQALSMILPEVIGVRLTGSLEGIITATDLVLTITETLRKKGVVGKFVEYFGDGLTSLTLEDRATIANMCPEYGATCGFFPIDKETIEYLNLTGRSNTTIKLEAYAHAQCLWNTYEENIIYTDVVEIDLSIIESSLAGPKRPQDRVALSKSAEKFKTEILTLAKLESDTAKAYTVQNQTYTLNHGKVVIAAITSCTNTSNPYVMVAAGLLAKAAYEKGFQSKPWVKTSLAPGSQVVTEYLKLGNLSKYLDYLGFDLVGFGCTTCIGNSGPLKSEIAESIHNNQLIVTAVLSGNRNFEGRIHTLVQANYLASPPLVVAYAIAGDMNINLTTSPLGQDREGKDIYLNDIWPTIDDIKQYIKEHINAKIFKSKYKNVFLGDKNWQNIKTSKESTYNWNPKSSYISNPPFFNNIEKQEPKITDIIGAKILAIVGDSITTDHISPAGNILANSPAGQYLMDLGTTSENFNSYGARRGNHEIMMRGTLSNMRIKNEMCGGKEGGITVNQLTGKIGNIYDVSMQYIENNIPSVIFSGKEYGTGSSRDWAAKGIKLLGVKAVIAESFERIHRSNLVGMGVLPLTFKNGMTRLDLNLTGSEEVSILGLTKDLTVFKQLTCNITLFGNIIKMFTLTLEVATDIELEYIRYGSIMHKVVKTLSNG